MISLATVSCDSFVATFSMDVIARVAFGIHLDSHAEKNCDFVTYAEKFFDHSLANYSVLIGSKFQGMTV